MSVYEQVKSAFQDIIAPEIRALQVEIKRLDAKIDQLDEKFSTKLDSLEGKLISEIRRLDTRIDSLERELKVAIDIGERLDALEAKLGT